MAIGDREKQLIGELCKRIGDLQTTVLTRRAVQIAEYIRELDTGELADQDSEEIERRMVSAMREADKTFERVGGSTRHHVIGCLIPVLAKHGLRLVAIEKKQDGGEA